MTEACQWIATVLHKVAPDAGMIKVGLWSLFLVCTRTTGRVFGI
jgi:hypothetical protein